MLQILIRLNLCLLNSWSWSVKREQWTPTADWLKIQCGPLCVYVWVWSEQSHVNLFISILVHMCVIFIVKSEYYDHLTNGMKKQTWWYSSVPIEMLWHGMYWVLGNRKYFLNIWNIIMVCQLHCTVSLSKQWPMEQHCAARFRVCQCVFAITTKGKVQLERLKASKMHVLIRIVNHAWVLGVRWNKPIRVLLAIPFKSQVHLADCFFNSAALLQFSAEQLFY